MTHHFVFTSDLDLAQSKLSFQFKLLKQPAGPSLACVCCRSLRPPVTGGRSLGLTLTLLFGDEIPAEQIAHLKDLLGTRCGELQLLCQGS